MRVTGQLLSAAAAAIGQHERYPGLSARPAGAVAEANSAYRQAYADVAESGRDTT